MFAIQETPEYLEWFFEQTEKIKTLIDARTERIRKHGHFGDAKRLYQSLSELRWKIGLRIYFTLMVNDSGKVIVLLLGGNKKTQKRDITKALSIVRRYFK